MSSLKDILNTKGFKIGIELVSTRGLSVFDKNEKAIKFGKELLKEHQIDWISITDSAGGHPAVPASVIGKELLNKGKEIIIHLTCKDQNRNGLESKAWELSGNGFHNVLAITGDSPATGVEGLSKPVFDLDSVGLLHLLDRLNAGLEIGNKKRILLPTTRFYTGAVISNFKRNENELVPQYLKLLKKIDTGASFVINQAGYDAVRMSEMRSFQQYKKLDHIHFIGNVFVLSKFTMNLFYKKKIPGVILPEKLYKRCKIESEASDKGRAFFLELAAKMMAIYKGLGFKGGYLGGIHRIEDYHRVMDIFNGYAEDDWKYFYKEMSFLEETEFSFFEKDPLTGLTNPSKISPKLSIKGQKTGNITFKYKVSEKFHSFLFTKDKGLYNAGKSVCMKKGTAPGWLYGIEKLSKTMMFDCKDCGDCSLDEIGYSCPESQCAKNQRNGPCGGSNDSICESADKTCIWVKAYERKKYSGDIWKLLDSVPVFQDHKLKGTSSWANYWLEKDHKNHNKL